MLNDFSKVEKGYPIYIHSHANNFIECMKNEELQKFLVDINKEIDKLRSASVAVLQEARDSMRAVEEQLEKQGYVFRDGQIILPKDSPIATWINYMNKIKELQANKRSLESYNFSSKNRKISAMFDDLYKQMSEDSTLSALLGEWTEESLKESVNQYLQKAFTTKTQNFKDVDFFNMTKQDLIKSDIWRRKAPLQKINNTLNNMIINFLVDKPRQEIKKMSEELLKDLETAINDSESIIKNCYSDAGWKDISQKLSAEVKNKRNISSKMGFILEYLFASNELRNSRYDLTLTNDDSFIDTYDIGKVGSSYDIVTTDIADKMAKGLYTLQYKGFTINSDMIGTSVKSTSKGQVFAKTMNIHTDEDLGNKVFSDWLDKNVIDKDRLFYILENYLALSRFTVTGRNKNGNVTGDRGDVEKYNLIKPLRQSIIGYGLLKALLGPFFNREPEDVNEKELNALKEEGLPLLLIINNIQYKMTKILDGLIKVVQDWNNHIENKNINLSYQVGTIYNINNLMNLANTKVRVPLEEPYEDSESFINKRIQTLWSNSDVQAILSHLQMTDDSLKKMVLKNTMVSFDAEQIYKL